MKNFIITCIFIYYMWNDEIKLNLQKLKIKLIKPTDNLFPYWFFRWNQRIKSEIAYTLVNLPQSKQGELNYINLLTICAVSMITIALLIIPLKLMSNKILYYKDHTEIDTKCWPPKCVITGIITKILWMSWLWLRNTFKLSVV